VEVKLQGHVFRTDLFILPLAGCDAVLGIQWLRTLGPILWDFSDLKMEFTHGGVPCILQGIKQGARVSLEKGDSFKLTKHEKMGVLLQMVGHSLPGLQLSSTNSPSRQIMQPGPMDQILKAYEDAFQEPQRLPPHRVHDHSIP